MLRVPKLKQPHSVACLPTCICAVLQFAGRDVTFEEVLEVVAIDADGSNPVLSVYALEEVGWNLDFMGAPTPEEIEHSIAEGQPIIANLQIAVRQGRNYCHAIVICDKVGDNLVVMDPAVGDYVEMPLERFMAEVEDGLVGAFHIGLAMEVQRTPER